VLRISCSKLYDKTNSIHTSCLVFIICLFCFYLALGLRRVWLIILFLDVTTEKALWQHRNPSVSPLHTPRDKERQRACKDSLFNTHNICFGRGSPSLNASVFQQLSGRTEEKRKKPHCLKTGPPQQTSEGLSTVPSRTEAYEIKTKKKKEFHGPPKPRDKSHTREVPDIQIPQNFPPGRLYYKFFWFQVRYLWITSLLTF
jgi:hypothetical protein